MPKYPKPPVPKQKSGKMVEKPKLLSPKDIAKGMQGMGPKKPKKPLAKPLKKKK